MNESTHYVKTSLSIVSLDTFEGVGTLMDERYRLE